MLVHYTSAGRTEDFEALDFYRDVAERLSKEDMNAGLVTVETDDGQVDYMIRQRSGTICINEKRNTMPESYLVKDQIQPKYLTCIDESRNAYKYYKQEVKGDKFLASWGRMGSHQYDGSCEFSLSMFWPKYQEKIAKGYVDRTDLYLESSPVEAADKKKKNKKQYTASTPSKELYGLLLKFAKGAVKEAMIEAPITEAIIEASGELIERMRNSKELEEFNASLKELAAILQRPVSTGDGMGVRNMLAKDPDDFAKIVERETDLLAAMEGCSKNAASTIGEGDFSDYGIDVFIATEEQKKQVFQHLSNSLTKKVKEVYRVVPKRQKERFDRYIDEHHIKTVKQFWHGSRNQNWMSIVQNGLLLNPNAVITGKMFGKGIYFSQKSMKSWNYTSFNGTTWASGKSNTGIMGLYATAYGSPLEVKIWSSFRNYGNDVKTSRKDCLHAYAGQSLKADEIVFYDEAAVLLQYIVVFH